MMDENQQLDLLIRRWLGMVPSPRGGRSALLHRAALLNQPKPVELAWFDIPGMHHPMDRELHIFGWTPMGGFQPRLSGLYLSI